MKDFIKPPKDIKQWWMTPCCGPGTLDSQELCVFCGETHQKCAELFSESVKLHPEWNHDGSILGTPNDDPEDQTTCGGSGFWCSGCERFWAADTCGNLSPEDMRACDKAKQKVRGRKVFCICGKQLATMRPESDYER
jgi:hypothetical protein